jgi:subtilase family serine protease
MQMHSSRLRRGLRIAAATTFSAALVGVGATSANASPPGHKSFPGSVPSFVNKAHKVKAKTMSPHVSSDQTVEGEIYLNLQDEIGAQKLATAVSTPGNSKYGDYMKPSKWIDKYAPTRSQVAQVKKYLRESGMTITAIPKSREYVVFRGPASDTASAFGTKLENYKVDGKVVSAPSSAPKLPAKIADQVTAVQLGNARLKLTHPQNVRPGDDVKGAKPKSSKKPMGSGVTKSGKAKASKQKAGPKAKANEVNQCSDYYGEFKGKMPSAYGKTKFPTYLCGYLPAQLRSAANLDKSINAGYDGSGQTVAIVDAYASPTIKRDTNDYMLSQGEPLMFNYQQIVPKPSDFKDKDACQQPSGWQGEQTLDVESAHSVAPGAKIFYSGGFNCGGGLDIAVSRILDKGLANIVSNSYGNTGEAVGNDVLRGEQNIHIQAAGEGIGMYFSSGDNGDESTSLNSPAPDFPASSPFVTAVGGTSEAIGADGNYIGEVGWGDRLDQVEDNAYTSPLPGDLYGGGAGGGVSRKFSEPDYQKGVVPKSLANEHGNGPSRVVPDVADLADPYTGFQIAIRPIINDQTLETGPLEYQTYGGTSLASPLVAAKMAIAQQIAGHQTGFANPALYQAAQKHPKAFHDVTPPAQEKALKYHSASGTTYLVTTNQGGTLKTAKGYDTMTGVGSLKTVQLANALGKKSSNETVKCHQPAGPAGRHNVRRPGLRRPGCMTKLPRNKHAAHNPHRGQHQAAVHTMGR